MGVSGKSLLSRPLPARCTGLAVAAAVHLSPACGAGKMLRGYFGVECIKSRGLVRRDGRASKECLHTGSIGGAYGARRFAASTRMSAYYSARIASPTPIASHRPTASPTMSHLPLSLMVILPARQLGQHHHLAVEPYWERRTRTRGGHVRPSKRTTAPIFPSNPRGGFLCSAENRPGPFVPSVTFQWAN